MKMSLTPAALGLKGALPTCQASYEAKFNYDAMVRKWQYLFAYASAGFARGYITWYAISPSIAIRTFANRWMIYLFSHMWTFIRGVSSLTPSFVACWC